MSLLLAGIAIGFGACRMVDEAFSRDWRRVGWIGAAVAFVLLMVFTGRGR